MPIALAFPNQWGQFKAYANDTITGPDFGFYDLMLPFDGLRNMGGNVIAMPPDASRKFGTVIYGAGIDPEFEKMIDRQKILPKCSVDLSGVENLGHIDEILCVVPGAVLVADFRAARNLLRIQTNQSIQTEHRMMPIADMVRTYLPDDPAREVQLQAMEVAADAALSTVSPHIPAGMAVIRIPVFFKMYEGTAPPNPINSLIINNQILMPDPCWKPARDAIQVVAPGVNFVNTVYFSKNFGDLHCATNAIRERR
jgi:agmatine/peptidylarginine deiminase